jgi:hypothetical protein
VFASFKGSDATFEFIKGRDHFDLYEGGLRERLARARCARSLGL